MLFSILSTFLFLRNREQKDCNLVFFSFAGSHEDDDQRGARLRRDLHAQQRATAVEPPDGAAASQHSAAAAAAGQRQRQRRPRPARRQQTAHAAAAPVPFVGVAHLSSGRRGLQRHRTAAVAQFFGRRRQRR